ncbi:hypothetical protein [Anoxybacteroides tepidamans]|uniref:hypothetical protein n=1 Tax=Anoxybacteroides tepidamans TaxID=265948 RepID=UPI0006866979|nr:hypothetical protein [Anoxybacillus tepidamans]
MRLAKTKTFIISIVLLLQTFLLTACSTFNTAFMDFKEYEGRPLKIGVIGKPPEVREKNVEFVSIKFSDLENEKFNSYDAVFIMKEHLSEAAASKYAKVYRNSKIPFFFIQSEKSYLPFVDESLTYEGALKTGSKSYATGYLNTKSGPKYWEYRLYNDIKNKKTIQEVFSRIFMTIEENTKK